MSHRASGSSGSVTRRCLLLNPYWQAPKKKTATIKSCPSRLKPIHSESTENNKCLIQSICTIPHTKPLFKAELLWAKWAVQAAHGLLSPFSFIYLPTKRWKNKSCASTGVFIIRTTGMGRVLLSVFAKIWKRMSGSKRSVFWMSQNLKTNRHVQTGYWRQVLKRIPRGTSLFIRKLKCIFGVCRPLCFRTTSTFPIIAFN